MMSYGGADIERRFEPDSDPIPDASHGEKERRRLQFRIRSLMLLTLVAAILFAVLLHWVIGPPAGLILVWIGVTIAFMLFAMSLTWVGFRLFALGDRVIAWFQRATRWPES
jgi:hypothetical protein